MEGCPLCKREPLTKQLYEDDVCWIAYCTSHPSKILIVLKRHTPQPSPEEAEHMYEVAHKLFPNKQWRYPASLKNHFHLHEV